MCILIMPRSKIMDTAYIYVLFEEKNIRGYFHSLQRAKRTAKELGLSWKMKIVAYEMKAGEMNKCHMLAKEVHSWHYSWSCVYCY